MTMATMDEDVRAYIEGIAPEHRPLFDRLHRGRQLDIMYIIGARLRLACAVIRAKIAADRGEPRV
jgi:hypothetical protein